MIKILSINDSPLPEIPDLPFLNVGGGARKLFRQNLTFTRATIDRWLSPALDAIIATADLQGREMVGAKSGWGRLLGEVLPEYCDELSKQGLIPPLARVGAVLGGDFFTRPQMDKRGGTGDITAVLEAFAQHFKWVVAVTGNHDVVPDIQSLRQQQPNLHLLDGNCIELDGLRIAGLSGVVGNPDKPGRRTEGDFAKTAAHLANMNRCRVCQEYR